MIQRTTPPAIRVTGLSKAYTIQHGKENQSTLAEQALSWAKNPFRRTEKETFLALKDIDLEIQQGDIVGIIGRNGAGKSTLLKVLSRITPPTAGKVELFGRVGSLLEVGTGFHPELSGRENIYLNGAILGMTRPEIRKQFDAIVDFAGVEKFLDTPVKRYSSGMYVRLAFAVAAHMRTEILIVDEVLAVGDAEFQKKCLGKMQDVAQGEGRTVLFVSHNMQSVRVLCSRALLLSDGKLVVDSDIDSTIQTYLNRDFEIVDIAEARDRRPGSGELRFTSITPAKTAFNSAEQIDIDFTVVHDLPSAPGQFFVSCVIRNDMGVEVVHCDSRMVGHWMQTGPEHYGRFTLRSPWLRPGQYSVEMCICNSGIMDRVELHGLIEVSPLLPYPATGNTEATRLGVVFADFAFEQHDEALITAT
jgi:homopolymeric O-antigen transport system ATP-binding protein